MLASSSPDLTTALAAFMGVFFAALLVAIGYYPIHRRRVEEDREHRDRIERTCDLMLGRKADPTQGRYHDEPGLAHTLPINGYRMDGVATIMERVQGAHQASEAASASAHAASKAAEKAATAADEARQAAEQMSQGQRTLSEHMERHIELDDERFGEILRRLDET